MSGAAQVWQRLRLMVAQGVGRLVGAEFVQVEILDGEVLPKVRRIEPYGMSSRPKTGCEVYVVFPAGDRSQGLALVTGDKRYQMDLAEGEVALHDDDGNFVKLGHGGVVTVKAKTKVVADTPLVEATGDMKVAGHLTVGGNLAVTGSAAVTGGLSQGGKDVGAGHKHTSSSAGLPTSTVI